MFVHLLAFLTRLRARTGLVSWEDLVLNIAWFREICVIGHLYANAISLLNKNYKMQFKKNTC